MSVMIVSVIFLSRSFIDVNDLVGSLYNFAETGVGKYSFEPITSFVFSRETGQSKAALSLIRAQVASSAVEVEITGGIETRELKSVLPRAVPTCDDSIQKAFIASR